MYKESAYGRFKALIENTNNSEDRSTWTTKEWYSHLGAWETEAGNICFGSVISFGIMLEQFVHEQARQVALSSKDLIEEIDRLRSENEALRQGKQ